MRLTHSPVTIDGVSHDVSHLNCFGVVLPNMGKQADDLRIEIVFSCHVYTERSEQRHICDVKDHRGNARCFDFERHQLSLTLPQLVGQALRQNDFVYTVKDHNQISNLALFKLQNNDYYRVVHFFEPHNEFAEFDLRMNVVSAYIAGKPNSKGNRLSYFARKCLFETRRVPK